MFGLTALELARIQFGFTITFHIIFPAITIGLASFLAVLEGMWLWRGQPVYRTLYHFWSRIFAVNFGMGVVSGLVMAYQFGTNWSAYSAFAGSITGPLLTYEVLTAFFLEAGFLGVMLFGWNKVGPRLHFFATLMVALGTLISATWILASNSWMQTPQGHAVIDGVVVPVDWLAIIFNPSFPYRLAHMVVAAFLCTALFVGASAAWHLLRGQRTPAIRLMFSMAMGMLLVATPMQIVIGDLHGLNTLKHQPAKLAAMEGHWENQPGESVPLLLFGWPDMKAETTRYAVGIPHLGSLILTHSWDGQYPGLKSFAPEDRPNATIVFWTFRVMVGLGLLMLVLGIWSAWAHWRRRAYESRRLLRFALLMGPAGIVAMLAGWYTTEIGRQPWIVYGLMRTQDAVSHHDAGTLSLTLVVLVVAYLAVFGAGVVYMMRLVAQGPDPLPTDPTPPLRTKDDTMGIDLPLIWLLIIGFSVLMYIVADGFDLGVGILFPWVRARAERDIMVNTVAPVWDGNETWLVLGGAGLMAAFPLAYAVVLSALYLPLLLMLLGLIWRGVSFEFRVRAVPGHQAFWDTAFMLGSFAAAFFQGVVLGAFIEGIPVIDGQAHYGTLDWLTPFSLMTGLGVVVSYALLGATWLVMKTEGALQARMIQLTRPVTWLLLAAIVVVSVWTPWQLPAIAERWFSLPNLLWFLPVPVLVLLATCRILASLPRDPHTGPFLWALLLVFLGFSGFVISIWPNIVPPHVTIRAAAGPDASLGFTLVGALLIVPIILAYTAWSYSVFRGKVTADEGYH